MPVPFPLSLNKCLGRTILLVAISLSFPLSSFGEAFRILDQGAAATGQGTAFAAQADDPSAIHYNPAGITQLEGIQFSIGTNLIGGNVSFESSTGARTDGDFAGTIANPPPSNFYITANLQNMNVPILRDISLGFGVPSPFGILIEYPDDSPIQTVLTKAALPLIDLKPTIAVKLSEVLSLGLGLDIYTFTDALGEGHAEVQRKAGPEFNLLGIPTGTPLEVTGQDTATGFNVSLLLTPLRHPNGKTLLNMGFVYRNQVTLDLKGVFLVNGAPVADTRAEFALPQVFSGALAVWPIRDAVKEWKVELDVDYADWSTHKNLNLQLSNGAPLPFPPDFMPNYGQAYIVMVGTEYKWLTPPIFSDWEISVRGGYVHSETPIPEMNFDPAVPDSDYNAFSVGLGLLCQSKGLFLGLIECGQDGSLGTQAIGFDLAYQAVLYDSRTINTHVRSDLGSPSVVIGTWDTTVHVGAINLRMVF